MAKGGHCAAACMVGCQDEGPGWITGCCTDPGQTWAQGQISNPEVWEADVRTRRNDELDRLCLDLESMGVVGGGASPSAALLDRGSASATCGACQYVHAAHLWVADTDAPEHISGHAPKRQPNTFKFAIPVALESSNQNPLAVALPATAASPSRPPSLPLPLHPAPVTADTRQQLMIVEHE